VTSSSCETVSGKGELIDVDKASTGRRADNERSKAGGAHLSSPDPAPHSALGLVHLATGEELAHGKSPFGADYAAASVSEGKG
jgi:hypothetical protein